MKWSGQLSKAGDTILHQHAIQGDITPVQQAVWYVNVFINFIVHRLRFAVHCHLYPAIIALAVQ